MIQMTLFLCSVKTRDKSNGHTVMNYPTGFCTFMHNLPDWMNFPQSSAAEMHETVRRSMKMMTVVFRAMTGGDGSITWSTTVSFSADCETDKLRT